LEACFRLTLAALSPLRRQGRAKAATREAWGKRDPFSDPRKGKIDEKKRAVAKASEEIRGDL